MPGTWFQVCAYPLLYPPDTWLKRLADLLARQLSVRRLWFGPGLRPYCNLSPLFNADQDSPRKDGSEFMNERLTVQFARGSKHRENAPGPGPGSGGFNERAPPRPRRTQFRMQISGLPNDTSWQVCCTSPPSSSPDSLDAGQTLPSAPKERKSLQPWVSSTGWSWPLLVVPMNRASPPSCA
jgi:hypothetical protein